MTPRQCKAARALLDWNQADLATASGVSLRTVAAFESGVEQREPIPTTLDALKRAFVAHGVVLAQNGSEGVSLRRAGKGKT